MDAGLSKLSCCGSKWQSTFSSALATLLASRLTLPKKMTIIIIIKIWTQNLKGKLTN